MYICTSHRVTFVRFEIRSFEVMPMLQGARDFVAGGGGGGGGVKIVVR